MWNCFFCECKTSMNWNGTFNLPTTVSHLVHFEDIVTPQNIDTSEITVLLEQASLDINNPPQKPTASDYIEEFNPSRSMSSFHGGPGPSPARSVSQISCHSKSCLPGASHMRYMHANRQDIRDIAAEVGHCYTNDPDTIPWVCSFALVFIF